MRHDKSRGASLSVHRGGGRRLLISGELDAHAAPTLVALIVDRCLENAPGPVELDCSDVRFIDASGVSALLAAAGHARRQGRELRLDHRSRCVERLLELCGISRL
jgi:anti-anti-sigma factor